MSPTTTSLAKARQQQLLHARAEIRCAIARRERLEHVSRENKSRQHAKRALKEEREHHLEVHREWKRDVAHNHQKEKQEEKQEEKNLLLENT